MKQITMYYPKENETFQCVPGSGYNNKGKNAPSYTKDSEGNVVIKWIEDCGGLQTVIDTMLSLLDHNHDVLTISRFFNIAPPTCKAFITKYLPPCDQDLAIANMKRNSTIRRRNGRKGKPSKLKGKTYTEIHGTKAVQCGFKKGHLNPNYFRNKFFGKVLTNSTGKKFRSSYEVRFSEILEKHNIPFENEHTFKMLNDKIKVVDFIINDTLVEVTGYAYSKWKDDFDIKIALLHLSYPNKKIIIISTSNNLDELHAKHGDYALILDLDDELSIVSTFQESICRVDQSDLL